MLSTIIIVLLILLLIGALPHWGYASWGVAPSGLIGVLIAVVIVLALIGRL